MAVPVPEFIRLERRFELRSALTLAEATQALAEAVEAPRWFRFWGSGSKAFEGTLTDSAFDIQRIISYRNSFLPRIRGQMRADSLGCVATVTIAVPGVGKAFLLLWFALAAFVAVAVLARAAQGTLSTAGALAPFAMFGFGWLLATLGFTLEANRAERLLREIVKGVRWPVS